MADLVACYLVLIVCVGIAQTCHICHALFGSHHSFVHRQLRVIFELSWFQN